MRMSLLLMSLLCSVLLVPSSAWSQTDEEEQAYEKLEEAKKYLDGGDYEKARKSADTALRLYPALSDAMMYKALAYEGLGELKRAKGLLSTFMQVSLKDDMKEQAQGALERIQARLGEERQAVVDQEAAVLAGANSESESEADGEDDGEDEDEGEADGEADGDSQDEDLSTASAKGASSKANRAKARSVPLDMPSYPTGSEEFLSWMLYRQQLALLKVRQDVGFSLVIGGGSLVGLGVGIAGTMAGLSAQTANDPNIEAGYAAGLGAVFSGATLVIVGLPMVIMNAVKAKNLSSSRTSTAKAGPRLEAEAGAIALRF